MTPPDQKRDHGGGLDDAIARFGGVRTDWVDLSTGINPVPYPLPQIPARFWQALPDSQDQSDLLGAARQFWNVPQGAAIAAASGVSALIAALPRLAPASGVGIARPTYNEHAASFAAFGWAVGDSPAEANVYVHPNNPDGRLWDRGTLLDQHRSLTIIDESFCDISPAVSHMDLADREGFVVLKGLGKFWGLAGVRLGFAMARPETIAKLEQMLGPWAISGPAQHIGLHALSNGEWADTTRIRLQQDAARLDTIATGAGYENPRGTSLFRLYDVEDAEAAFDQLAKGRILSRIFPYSKTLIRLGLPGTQAAWTQLQKVLE
ncbi:threonine-phosphate decarboxylase [Neptunicoccus cionae]|uniref:threonine-phosphate decarboxylase n=1 Tax=Neptunicoccus cionae TaxID=2035344 RepID=UPI000C7755A2|nr:threonine-phosphate decarboxylase [Amylibacter cionae]PLS23136.1 threonine-phosphate decarboxylase [Amylibacter cionae]